jgi:mannose-6-phosphate isomerase
VRSGAGAPTGAERAPRVHDRDHARRGAARTQPRPTRGVRAPLVLPPNQLARFYRGGVRIDRLRRASTHVDTAISTDGDGAAPTHVDGGPEDWVGSTTTALGADSEGLSRLPDGRYLRDAIDEDPIGFLGPEHVRRWGSNPALLVKLLDAGERLPVHFHPGRAFARRELGLAFGKTEAWIIVEAEPDAVVHLGLKTPVGLSTVQGWVRDQAVPAMLAAMHVLPVQPGTTLFVPAGTLHAIGSGILLVELQEPTDMSVLLEWERFDVSDGSETLGLGWDRVLGAADLEATRPEELVAQDGHGTRGTAITDLLPSIAAPYFRAQWIRVDGDPVHLDPAFSILVVLDGWMRLWSESTDPLDLRGGDTALIPHGAGPTTLDGHASVIRCLPPAPEAEAGQW